MSPPDPLPGYRRLDFYKKDLERDRVFSRRVGQGMKYADWTADTVHMEINEYADRRRPPTHDLGNGQVGKRSFIHDATRPSMPTN